NEADDDHGRDAGERGREEMSGCAREADEREGGEIYDVERRVVRGRDGSSGVEVLVRVDEPLPLGQEVRTLVVVTRVAAERNAATAYMTWTTISSRVVNSV